MDKITIITTPHDNHRYPYLLRFLEYYESYGFTAKIMVLNSCTGDPEPDKLRRLLAHRQISNMRFDHEISPEEKLLKGLERVSTPYVVVVSEDDLVSVPGMSECVSFLESNADYATAHGHYIKFHYYKGGRNLGRCFSWDPLAAYVAPSIHSDDPMRRLYQHLARHTPTFYAVHRKGDLLLNMKKTVEYSAEYEKRYNPFYELLPSCLSLVQGKSKRLDLFYAARESIENSSGQTHISWKKVILSDDFHSRYLNFRKCLITAVDAKKEEPDKLLEDVIDKGFARFITDRLSAERAGMEFFDGGSQETSGSKDYIKNRLYEYNLLKGTKDIYRTLARGRFMLMVIKELMLKRKDDFPLLWWLNVPRRIHDIDRIKEDVVSRGNR